MKQNIFKNRKGTHLTFFFALGEKVAWNSFRKYIVIFFLSFLFFGVKKANAQCTLGCQGAVNVALDSNGEFQVTPMLLLTSPLCDPNDFSVSIVDANGNPVNNLLDCNQVGETLVGTVTHLVSGNSCSGIINVSDNLAPTIQCLDTYIFCYENADPNIIDFPNVSDNCTSSNNINLSYVDNFTDLPCYTPQGGFEITAQIERIWAATDAFGNQTTCTQYVYYKRVTTTDVVFPLNRDGFEAPVLDCSQNPNDLTIAGQPTIGGIPITSGGLCELAIDHTDQPFNICGTGSYQIIRTWTAVDWCNSEFLLDAQVIKVIDTTAPTITCPNDITVGTSNSCTGTVTFPTTTATDDCSNYNITVAWQFGNGYGPFNDVPLGSYPATYTATDDCNNVSTCVIQVNVVDDVSPIAICEGHLNINLPSSGTTYIPAATFDGGSFDNCAMDKIEVSRDGVNFGNDILLDCADIGQGDIEVTLRVQDVAGHINQCEVMVTVNDNIAPTIICPLATTISCDDDFNDTSITGVATATDVCGMDTIYFQDVMNLNSCNVGTITRTWTAIDQSGNPTGCTQILTVEDNTPLQITFPQNIDLNGCNSSTAPSNTGEPTFVNDDCESIGVSHDDIEFTNEAGLCIKILRTWTVVDWCIYQPNSGSNAGYYTFVQVIKIIDDGSGTTYTAAGVITAMNGAPMNNVTIHLQSANVDTTILVVNGVYDFSDIPMDSSVTITPFKDGDDGNGVNTIDMIFIRKHILGLTVFDSPYKYIAGDVNNSGSVSTFDLVIIRQLILLWIPEFPHGDSWVFVDADYTFSNPSNPLTEDYPTSITFTPEEGEEYNFDFVAIKRGDVNGSASPD